MGADQAKKKILEEMEKLSPKEREALVDELSANGMFTRAPDWLCSLKRHGKIEPPQ